MKKILDHSQGVPGPRTIKRVFSAEFDTVFESGEFFIFKINGRLIASVSQEALNEKQINFFRAISIPPR